ncbi:MAG: dicarboxylate/amino acid:cation symporter [Candidatus Egerieousia sp.]
MRKYKIGLLPKIIIAIALGIGCAYIFPMWITRVFVTFNGLFGNFLSFVIPLIILGLVAPGIAELGKGAGKLLLITVAIAYGSTLFAGFFSYFGCELAYPQILVRDPEFAILAVTDASAVLPFFTIEMPPVFGVMTALIFAFAIGLGASAVNAKSLISVLSDFRNIVNLIISKAIIPLLPLFIFGIFLKLGVEGQVATILKLFIKVILVIFIMHILLLLIQFSVAGVVVRKNPLRLLVNMLPAYFTALGTQSSAATIPVTLKQSLKNGVDEELASFTVPLCATIHLAGSTLKIVACAFAIMWMLGMETSLGLYAGFICMLGVTMIAAPGVPGGAIMAALGVLESVLCFDPTLQALMIALYITMDSFGTACNVTGDGAIALVVNKFYKK